MYTYRHLETSLTHLPTHPPTYLSPSLPTSLPPFLPELVRSFAFLTHDFKTLKIQDERRFVLCAEHSGRLVNKSQVTYARKAQGTKIFYTL